MLKFKTFIYQKEHYKMKNMTYIGKKCVYWTKLIKCSYPDYIKNPANE